jgi:hypothetical protein
MKRNSNNRRAVLADRSFRVCDFCGEWWEAAADKNSAPVNYIFRFFLLDHSDCTKPQNGMYIGLSVNSIRESDPRFKLLDPRKEWRPEKCSRYQPPINPSSIAHKTIARKDLFGLWATTDPDGTSTECWRLNKNGLGFVGGLSIACCEFKFRWRLAPSNRIHLKLCTPEPDPPLDCFFTGVGVLTIADRTSQYGETSTVLRIEGPKGRIVELVKQTQDVWKQWKRSQL